MSSVHLAFQIETVIVFIIMTIGAVFIDLFMHRHGKQLSLKNAAKWSIFWVFVAIAFDTFLYVHYGAEKAILFLTGFFLEEILSIDNLFVTMAIFTWFGVPDRYRYRVFYWGILGAIVFRGIFVVVGTGLLSLGPYVEIIFAIIIGWTAIVMLRRKEEDTDNKDYSNHLVYHLVKHFYPIWPKIINYKFILSQKEVDAELEKPENQKMIIGRVKKKKHYVTPLLLCMVAIEVSDVIFAFDSVPAIIAISRDPLIIYSSMMFAILSLRTFYFVLEALKEYLVYVEKTVVFLLFFLAFNLALNATDHFWHHGYKISSAASLLTILCTLALGIVVRMLFSEK